MNKIKIYITIFLVIVLSFISFYGSKGIEDQFVYGKSRVSCAGSTITVKTPFELAVDGKQSDLSKDHSDTVVAAGADKNFQILIFGYKVDENTTPEIIFSEQCELLKHDENISDLNIKTGKTTIESSEAYVIDASFNEKMKKGNIDFIIKSYIFKDKQTVWKVIYQYKRDDEIGSILMQKFSGKIMSGFIL